MKPSLPVSLILAALAQTAFAQTTIVGDAWIAGNLGVGTTAPGARLEVLAVSPAQTVFQISGVDETPFLTVGSSGSVGMGIAPSAGLDVNGSGDSSSVGLELRNGTFYPSTGSYQMTFGYNGTSNLRHALRTVHSTTTANGSIDFFLWSPAVSTTAVGTHAILSLVTTSTGAEVHIEPVAGSTITVELMVSNGMTPGAGAVERLAEGAHSSRELKSDIFYLGAEDEARAYGDVRALKHATFRYKSWKGKDFWRKEGLARDRHQPIRRGLIYEDAPETIRRFGGVLIIDERVNNAELALKELIRRLESLQAEVSEQERKNGH